MNSRNGYLHNVRRKMTRNKKTETLFEINLHHKNTKLIPAPMDKFLSWGQERSHKM